MVEEVQSIVDWLSNSVPTPGEQIFTLMLKKGGDSVVEGLHCLFQVLV